MNLQYHITVPDISSSPNGLLILGILRAQLVSEELAFIATYEAPVASADTAVRVNTSTELMQFSACNLAVVQ